MFSVHPILIQSAAARHSLPPILIAAIIEAESSGNPWSWNPEGHYRWFWDVKRNRPFRTLTQAEVDSKRPPHDFPCLAGDRDQEWWAQQASWGLMQVMGAVAREHGYTRRYLTQLVDPEDSIEYGCRHLLALKGRYYEGRGWAGVISAYNQGSPRTAADGQYENQSYVDKVTKIMGGSAP